MFQLKPIVQGVLVACGGLASAALIVGPAAAQQTQQQQAQQKLERVTITGTNIRRTDTEAVAPVEIITREDIERTGLPTVADVLRSIPSNTAGTFNEYANSFAPGAQSISLRGLGQKATLVLINGRRVSSYGFAQNIQDTFVDLAAIPSSAVERIEILKDGASAIYGSDAIAGVVNVILRRDFKGFDTSAGAGFFEGKKDYRASLAGGWGELGSDKFNVFGVVDFFSRDELLMSDTKWGATRDMRRFQGGRNYTSLTAGGTWRSLVDPNIFRAIADCPTPLTYQQAVDAGFFSGNGPLPAGWNQPGNTFCTRDFANIFTIIPKSERLSGMLRATAEISPTAEAYIEGGLSQNKTKFTFQEPFFAGTSGLYPIQGQLASFPYNIWFQPGVSGNPLADPASYNGVLNDLGTRDTDIKSDTTRVLIGAKYTLGTWDLDSAAGYSENKIDQKGRVLLKEGTSAAFGVPSSNLFYPPVVNQFPFATNPAYNANQPSLNSQALRDSMMAQDSRKAKSELQFIDTKASTEIGQMPGGPIGLALGAEYRDETMTVSPSDLALSGGILGQGATRVNGSRSSLALFSELSLPITPTLEGQAALRSDRYSDFGTSLNPKVGFKFKASPEILLRANWGRGFRAPSLPEITESTAFFFTTITEPLTGLASNISGSISANPNLKPETSRSSLLGVVIEPTNNLNFGIDWYEITWDNQVAFPDFQAIADDPNDPRAVRAPAGLPNAGQVVAINGSYINVGRIKTRGTDFDVRWNNRTTFGRFVTRLNASYVGTYKLDGIELAGSNLAGAFLNAIAIPRVKGFIAVDWEQAAWVVSARANYIHSYDRVFGSGTLYNPPPATQLIQNGSLDRKAPSYTTYDIFARYNVTPRFQISASVLNLTGEEPPYEPGVSTTYFVDRTQYDVRRQQYRIGVRYLFN